MKLSIAITFCLSVFWGGFSQRIDTIYVNEYRNTALFFPEKIRQGIAGAPNFIFSYNEEQPQHFALLKATPGTTSNLLVLTEDGAVYSYVLKYGESKNLHYRFIGPDESVGNEKGSAPGQEGELVVAPVVQEASGDSLERRERYLQNLSSFYLRNSTGKLRSTKKGGLGITVEKMVHYRNEVFLVMEIENNSKVDFEPEYLKVYTRRGDRKRNASFQKILKEPIFRYGFPGIIQRGEKKRFVMVFPKFTPGENETIEVETKEKKGSRGINLVFAKKDN